MTQSPTMRAGDLIRPLLIRARHEPVLDFHSLPAFAARLCEHPSTFGHGASFRVEQRDDFLEKPRIRHESKPWQNEDIDAQEDNEPDDEGEPFVILFDPGGARPQHLKASSGVPTNMITKMLSTNAFMAF